MDLQGESRMGWIVEGDESPPSQTRGIHHIMQKKDLV